MVDLKAKPFNLSDDDVTWVHKTLAAMSPDEKIGQLFCLIAYSSEEGYLKNLAHNVRPGGLMCRVMPAKDIVSTVQGLPSSGHVIAVFEQPVSGVQSSVVQALPSSQFRSVPSTHAPLPSQVSSPSQRSESAHDVPTVAGMHAKR